LGQFTEIPTARENLLLKIAKDAQDRQAISRDLANNLPD
jgi:hypothetical protein